MYTLIAIAGLGILCLIAEIFNLRKAIIPVSIIGLLAILGITVCDLNTTESYYNNMVVTNRFSVAFSSLFILLTVFLIALGDVFYKNNMQKLSDFIAIKIFLLLGAVAMVSFGNLAMFFLGIEILSISLYVLAGSNPKDVKSNEAGMKYFLMGAFASGIILFGIAMIYGATGSFDIDTIKQIVIEETVPGWFFIGVVLLTIGLLFKIAAVPFHFWAPDVYQGAPVLTTATMSTLAKVAAMAAFFKLITSINHSVPGSYHMMLIIASVLSMTVGNIMALRQINVKRMLAYSGISHAGFMLMVFLNPVISVPALFYYTAAYSFAGIAAFAVILFVSKKSGNEEIYNFNGLGKTNPLMAAVLTGALLSMAGIPVFSGFFAKVFLFNNALDAGYITVVILAVVNSIISVGYYFKVIIAMYTKEVTEPEAKVPFMYAAVALLSILINIAMGIDPSFLMNYFL